jgi:ABC-2 type transport system permease protein
LAFWTQQFMRLFYEFGLRSFQRQLVYRSAALAGLVTNFFFGIIRIAVLVALYGMRHEVAGISIEGAITFTGLSQALIGVMSFFSWYELMNNVYTGAISSDLLKPMGLYQYWLSHDFGRAAGQLVLRGLPMMIAYAIFFGISTPQSLNQWIGFVISLILAWLVSFSWRFLVNLSAFWIPNAAGFVRFTFVLSWSMSGFFMPLRYFPDWFVKICSLTPFPYVINSVVEVYLGVVQGPTLVQTLLAQLFWFVGLMMAGELVLRIGIRKLVILGG